MKIIEKIGGGKIQEDLFRIYGCSGVKLFFTTFLKNPSFRFITMYRLFHGSKNSMKRKLYGLYIGHLQRKYGLQINAAATIGRGFAINHWGNIVVNGRAVIGNNVTICNGVTIGQTNRGKRMGCPTIMDGAYIGSGAKVIGRVTIGRNAAIGPNAVVTKDIPDNAVAVGVPAKVISFDGAKEYVDNQISL